MPQRRRFLMGSASLLVVTLAVMHRQDRVLGLPDVANADNSSVAGVDVAAGCEHVVQLMLQAQLRQMVMGRADEDSTLGERGTLYDPSDPVMTRVEHVDAGLLRTAAADLFGPYRRDVEALVVAYRPRIGDGCARG